MNTVNSIASVMALIMLILAYLVKFVGVQLDFHTLLTLSTMGVAAGALCSMLWSFRVVMPDWCGVESCA